MTRTTPKQPDPAERPELRMIIRGSQRPFKVAGQTIKIGYAVTYFPEYRGAQPESTWRKPVVGPPARPFAELQVVERLEAEDWTAGWAYRPGQFISGWEPEKTAVKFPKKVRELLERIAVRKGSWAGCWDVVACRKRELRFLELKRAGSSDRLRTPQREWYEAALAEGVPSSAFEVLEWFGGNLEGRVLRLTSYTYDKLDGWAEVRNGRLSGDVLGMIEHYRRWGARTEADLLWLTFARNYDGVTWCGIEQREVRHDNA